MITADRYQFIAAASGVLLLRRADAAVTQLGDAAIEAVEAAERGEIVYLTVDGVIVSKVVDKREMKIEKAGQRCPGDRP